MFATGQIAGTTATDAAGAFTFANVVPGNYVVELLDAAGNVVSTSAAVSVAAGAVTGVAIGAGAGAATAAAASTPFFASTLGVISIAAGAAAVAGVTVAATRSTVSPSR